MFTMIQFILLAAAAAATADYGSTINGNVFGFELRKDDCNQLNLFLLEAVLFSCYFYYAIFATIFNTKYLKWILFFRVKVLTMIRRKWH